MYSYTGRELCICKIHTPLKCERTKQFLIYTSRATPKGRLIVSYNFYKLVFKLTMKSSIMPIYFLVIKLLNNFQIN